MWKSIAALLLLILGAFPASAQTWTICNKDSEEATVAIGYAIPGSFRVASEGWWTLRSCGGCARVLLRRDTSDHSTVYMFAKNRKGNAVIEGNMPFCVAGHRFTIKGNDNCTRRGYRVERFDRTAVNMSGDHRTNLTPANGRPSRCPVRFD